MPTLTTHAPEDVVAWLRFADDGDGSGIRAALFETSSEGKPRAFFFTRIDRRDPSLRQAENPTGAALAQLAGALFRIATPPPKLVIGVDDNLTRQAVQGNLEIALPCALISPNRAAPFSTSWGTEEPSQASEARRLLDTALSNDDPAEPFVRVDGALAEAFEDETIQAMASNTGIMSIVSLLTLPERLEGSANIPQEPISESNHSPHNLTLAERLWMKLAPPPLAAPLPSEYVWPSELRPFQKEGIRVLLGSDQLLLADDMGLGKTVQAIAAIRLLRLRNEIESCLVVAPASLLSQWRKELDKWAPELSAIIIRGSVGERGWQWQAKKDIKLVSYEILRSDFGDNPLAPVRRTRWGVVIADEAQRIKNRNDTSDALKGLQRTRSWALTGTPIENHEDDLASILEFVDYAPAEKPRRYSPGLELRARHRELQLRRRKEDVLDDLPPKQVTMVPIELGSNQQRSYDKAEKDGVAYLKSLGEVTLTHVLQVLTRLKQICNADPETGESSKLDDVYDRMEQLVARGHRALVFSQYVNDSSGVGAIVKRLQRFSPLAYTGGMSSEEKQETLERFRNNDNHKALALSLRAGGLGLNLQQASYVFHLDRWWNPATERQAEDRSHRIGQGEKVNVIKYYCIGTVEERIDKILESKQALFDDLVDDVSLDSSQLSREDLFGLFDLKPPPVREGSDGRNTP